MLCEQKGAETVDLERLEGFCGVDLRGRLFRVEDAGDAEGETEGIGGEAGGAVRCGGGYCGFI